MKYGMPTDDGKTVGAVFGRARSFAIYDDADSSMVVVPNEGIGAEHGAGTGAAAFLVERGVGVVLAPEVGPKAASVLAASGVRVERVAAGVKLSGEIRVLSAPLA